MRTAHYTQAVPPSRAMTHIKALRWIADFAAATPRVAMTGEQFLRELSPHMERIGGTTPRLWQDDVPEVVPSLNLGLRGPMLRAEWLIYEEHRHL